MTPKKFQETIWKYYRENKRSFAWRETLDPYAILVSEIMLQQTQTERVKIKYAEWMKLFPTVESLAYASLQKVLESWQGLGYNRRALALKHAAETIAKTYDGKFPDTFDGLLELPGIGPYTAGAVMAFAFNKPFPVIETNIRTVYIHFFFGDKFGQIHDKELLPLIKKTLPRKASAGCGPREWYYALMDYGVYVKKNIGNLNKRSRHYTKQSKFEGSNRQIRSGIVKAITFKPHTSISLQDYFKKNLIEVTEEQIIKNLIILEKEGFITQQKNKFHIA
ncbi:A/G-specific adenine glycosylase [Patescibacteria group bacterium]|nr:A/G-specific adenine glycosylase [Patescibacteria group bacterium]